MTYWNEKAALVTGGSAGLGKAIARSLVSAGARVALVARDASNLRSAADELGGAARGVVSIPADVTREDDVARMAERAGSELGTIDGLFHGAGRSDRGEALATPVSRFDELWRINFVAAVLCAQALAPALRAARGHLVLIGSLASKSASRHLGAYPAAKFALAAFAQQMRLEHDARELHTLLVCPGPLARVDAGSRYDARAVGLPDSARRPGGGVKLKGLDPERLAARILDACRDRRAELIVPGRARMLFALSQLSPAWGDWFVRRMT